jgi:phosphoribosylformimino-5-aminoimidazole carboxamide ribotide isomerase
VGSTLSDATATPHGIVTNFESDRPASWFADQYRRDGLVGGHVIKLGPGNDDAARAALQSWPGAMQLGGGISIGNALDWLNAGASHVIVTSWLFVDGVFSAERLASLVHAVGRDQLVIDLSCRWREGRYWVVTDRWQRFTSLAVEQSTLHRLADSCAEFLVHGVDVEGLSQGIDLELVTLLAEAAPIPCTYAGGAKSIDDLRVVHELSDGRVDLTIGSALDLFGGRGVRYADCVEFNRQRS